jgi:hypothetical protein
MTTEPAAAQPAAASAACTQQLLASLDQCRQRLRAVCVHPETPPQQTAELLCDVERDYLQLWHRAAQEGADVGQQHFPLLAEASRWCATVEGLGLDAGEVHALLHAAQRDAVAQWHVHCVTLLRDGDCSALFEALIRNTQWLSEFSGAAAGALRDELLEIREQLRRRWCELLTEAPPDEATREAWTTALIDRCNVVLTSIDEQPPARAAMQLELVIDDVAWFLPHAAPRRGKQRRALRRKLRRISAERQERWLQARLERLFGRVWVGRFERLIFVLILMVLGLLLVEWLVDLSPTTALVLAWSDFAICCVFLWEFFFKLSLAPQRGRWFLRHALIDLLPSIPFSFLFGITEAADAVRAGRAARLARLPRFARYLRVMRPLIRLVRAFGFLARGLDRLVRSYGRLLNHNIVLFPTRQERQRLLAAQQSLGPRLLRLHDDLTQRWQQLLMASPREALPALAAVRTGLLHEAVRQGWGHAPLRRADPLGPSHEVLGDTVLRRLAEATPESVETSLGEELLARLARVVRIFSWPPLRWLPLVAGTVPRISARMRDAEVVSAAARALAQRLQRYRERWLWFADLYGTVTPSQFLDRLGSMLVRTSFRPTYRLALFGGMFLLTEQLLRLIPGLQGLYAFLARFVGTPLLVLGGVCCVVLGIGWWLKRLAREATEFYERSAHAQFLSLTETLRNRNLTRDAWVLYHRVLRHEWLLREPDFAPHRAAQHVEVFVHRVRESLLGELHAADETAAFEALDRVVLLYRDALDGALFCDSDTRTTTQLLGNPSLGQMLELTQRVTRRERRAVRKLDLERQKAMFHGPYLWFNFISKAVAHSTAALLLDYNRHALPSAELELATPEERARYESWLAADEDAVLGAAQSDESAPWITTAFTALHFLDDAPHRDRDVERQFGARVADRLRRDRRSMFRRIFGGYPVHQRPKAQRVLNLRELYDRRLAGGRALLLPLVVAALAARRCWAAAGWLGRAIGELRHPERRARYRDAGDADFLTAVRKIDRMRGPVVRAAMSLRARFDPEYLGVALPGTPDQRRQQPAQRPPVDADLRFLDAGPEERRFFENERRRAEADMRRLARLLDDGLLSQAARHVGLPHDAFDTAEHRRAAAAAYVADYRGVRNLLSARDIIDEVFRAEQLQRRPDPRRWPRPRLARLFRRYWRKYGRADRAARAAAWRATVLDIDQVRQTLGTLDRYGDAAFAEGLRVLAELLRHPQRITQQLVTLRCVQTMAMLDVLDYRQHVFRLGQYEDAGPEIDALLHWEACNGATGGAPSTGGRGPEND